MLAGNEATMKMVSTNSVLEMESKKFELYRKKTVDWKNAVTRFAEALHLLTDR